MAHALPLLPQLEEGSPEDPDPYSEPSVVSIGGPRLHLQAPLDHRALRDGDFWRRVPAYAAVSRAEFLDHHWQAKNSITRPERLLHVLRDLAEPMFVDDVAQALEFAPMA